MRPNLAPNLPPNLASSLAPIALITSLASLAGLSALAGLAPARAEVDFRARVVSIGDGDTITLGAPTLGGASVAGEIVEQTRSDKVITYKKKPWNTYRRKLGHRQHMTVVKITGISAS